MPPRLRRPALAPPAIRPGRTDKQDGPRHDLILRRRAGGSIAIEGRNEAELKVALDLILTPHANPPYSEHG